MKKPHLLLSVFISVMIAASAPHAQQGKFNSSLKFLKDMRSAAPVGRDLLGGAQAVVEAEKVTATVQFDHILSVSEIGSLQRLGVVFFELGDGAVARTGSIYPLRIPWSSLEGVSGRTDVLRIEGSWNPAVYPCLDVSRHETQADVTWSYTDPYGSSLTGKGMRIADFDTGIDVFHPSFFFADGDTFDWIDVDENGAFTAGTDVVDLDDDGVADAGELLDYTDGYVNDYAGVWGPTNPANNGNGYQTYWDWLYNDADGDGERDFGTGAGYTESDPTFGELYFVALDDDRDGGLDVGERLVALGTSKVYATLNEDEIERVRGTNLILSDPDANGHGTGVSGILAGGTPGVHILAGLAPDAELLMGYLFSDVPVSALIPWARSRGADVMLYEVGGFIWRFLDGSSLEEQLVTTENATIIQVTASGNLGGGGKHSVATVPGSGSVTLQISVPTIGGNPVNYFYETSLWRTGLSDLTFKLRSPLGGQVTLTGSVSGVDGYYIWYDKDTSSRGTAKLDLYVSKNLNPNCVGTWELTIENNTGSAIEVVSNVDDPLTSWSGGAKFLNYASNEKNVTWPATADSSFVVGSYSTRGFEGYSGEGGGSISPGEISTFSGRGVRVDGHHLLDICTPGNYDVYTTQSHQASAYPLGSYMQFSGTSAAAPHGAAAAAIVRQAFPAAGMPQIAHRMTSNAATDSYTGFVYNDTWGWGKLRILEAATGISFTIDVTAPNGGEVWDAGEAYDITWTAGGAATPDSVGIFLSLDSGRNYPDTVMTGVVIGNFYSWTVPNLPVTTARIKVEAYYGGGTCGFDASDDDFTIKGKYRYVSTTGGNVYPYSRPEWAAHEIQDALDASDTGDTILVAAHTYTNPVTVEKRVYLKGGWNSTFTACDPETYVTIIQSTGSPVSFMNVSGGYCGIEGFTITGGTGRDASIPASGKYGGGIFSYHSSPVIRGNRITDCGEAKVLQYSAGGAIACYDGEFTIEGNTITGSSANSGGGIYLYQTTGVIRDNRVTGSAPNAEYGGTKYGGGVFAFHSTVDFECNVIAENDGFTHGGGVAARFSTVTVDGDTVSSNDCVGSGGGMYFERTGAQIAHTAVLSNTATSTGGGIFHRANSLDIGNSLVALNSSDVVGGGIYVDSVWGAVTNNTLDRNTGSFAGGNCFLTAPVSLSFTNNMITFGQQNGFQAGTLAGVTFQYNDCYGNVPADVAGVTPDTTNASRDPRYADTTSLDYHLLVHSGGIDGGDPLGGADPDGSRADQGLYGGPAAVTAAPACVQNLAAAAAGDTTIDLVWDEVTAPGLDYYAVYGDTIEGFWPGEPLLLTTVPSGVHAFSHHPVTGCWYYCVSAVNTAGYGGGYSNQDSACTAGTDTVPPAVTVVYPNGGEVFEAGDTLDIQWIATDNRGVDSVSIYCSVNGGDDFELVSGGEPNDSTCQWIVPSLLSDSCLVKIVAYDPALLTGEDVSDSLFSINYTSGDGDGPPAFANFLAQNYPNPFNPSTRIVFGIGTTSSVSLAIYDVSGRLVRVLVKDVRDAGRYEAAWNGKDAGGRPVTSGVYFYSLRAGSFAETRKMVLIR